jgi:peptidoglycan biosynthesis protein MviN/MurJ (putative lipid II flippase)
MSHEVASAIAQIINALFGWFLRALRRRLDRLPQRDFSELSTFGKLGRLVLMGVVLLLVLVPLGWLIWH